MEFADVLRGRRMVRRYDPSRPVPPALVDRLLAAGLRAPSAGFSQGWHFLALTDEAARAGYWAATTDPDRAQDAWLTGMRSAPLLIIAFSDRSAYERRYRATDKRSADHAPPGLDDRWPVPYWHVDAGMAAALILLAAVDAGLGACWFGVPTARVDAIRARFGVPAEFVPVGAITVGYPAEPAEQPAGPPHSPRIARRPWPEVVSYNRFGTASDQADGSASAP